MTKGKNVRQPMQGVVVADDGIVRFRPNAIIRHLVDTCGITLDEIYAMDFSDEDMTQLAQLTGYSVGAFADLDYAKKRVIRKAVKLAARLEKKRSEKR